VSRLAFSASRIFASDGCSRLAARVGTIATQTMTPPAMLKSMPNQSLRCIRSMLTLPLISPPLTDDAFQFVFLALCPQRDGETLLARKPGVSVGLARQLTPCPSPVLTATYLINTAALAQSRRTQKSRAALQPHGGLQSIWRRRCAAAIRMKALFQIVAPQGDVTREERRADKHCI
jgi:hypothetical protein